MRSRVALMQCIYAKHELEAVDTFHALRISTESTHHFNLRAQGLSKFWRGRASLDHFLYLATRTSTHKTVSPLA
eukprot:SAG31_NODE_5842_length_2301_cov_1.546776_3_plen_74_part_00